MALPSSTLSPLASQRCFMTCLLFSSSAVTTHMSSKLRTSGCHIPSSIRYQWSLPDDCVQGQPSFSASSNRSLRINTDFQMSIKHLKDSFEGVFLEKHTTKSYRPPNVFPTWPHIPGFTNYYYSFYTWLSRNFSLIARLFWKALGFQYFHNKK
jgi:hypothetical protein